MSTGGKTKEERKKRNKGGKAPRLNYVKKNWNNNFGKKSQEIAVWNGKVNGGKKRW